MSATIFRRSVYACLSATLLYASAQKSKSIYELFMLFDHFLPLCWR